MHTGIFSARPLAAGLAVLLVALNVARLQAPPPAALAAPEPLPAPCLPAVTSANFYVTPDVKDVSAGDVFTVDIRVDQLTETVRGWQVSLRYDPNVVTMTQFAVGSFMGCPQVLPTPLVWQAGEGEMLFGAVCLVGDSAGKTDGVLATLTLRAQAGAQPGAQSELAFDVAGVWKTKLVKQGGAEVIPDPANLHNGLVRNPATPAPGEPTFTPTPTATPTQQPGESTFTPRPTPTITVLPDQPTSTPEPGAPTSTFTSEPSPTPASAATPTETSTPQLEPTATQTTAPGMPTFTPRPTATFTPRTEEPTVAATPWQTSAPATSSSTPHSAATGGAPAGTHGAPTPTLPATDRIGTGTPGTVPTASATPQAGAVLVFTLTPSVYELTAVARPTATPSPPPSGLNCWPAASLSGLLLGWICWQQRVGVHTQTRQKRRLK